MFKQRKFKIGDKVRIIQGHYRRYGIIIHIYPLGGVMLDIIGKKDEMIILPIADIAPLDSGIKRAIKRLNEV